MNLANISTSSDKDDSLLAGDAPLLPLEGEEAAAAELTAANGEPLTEAQQTPTAPEHRPKELMCWREGIKNAKNLPQIMCCLLQLNKCIAWEKSVMKVVSECGFVTRFITIINPLNAIVFS